MNAGLLICCVLVATVVCSGLSCGGSRPRLKLNVQEVSWIYIELVDEAGQPVPGKRYRVTSPDGRIAEGRLDGNGRARIEGVEPGKCKIDFPGLDKDAWERM